MENNNEKTIELIKETIEKVRPFLQRDGGDCSFDSFEDGIVYVNMLGACDGCSLITSTLESGIEVILMEEVPGVIAVRLASEKEKIKQALEEIRKENETKKEAN